MKSFINFLLVFSVPFLYQFGINTYDEYIVASNQTAIKKYECQDFLNSIKELQWVQLNGCKVSFDEKIMHYEDIWNLNRRVYLFPIIEEKDNKQIKHKLFFKVSDLDIIKEYGQRSFHSEQSDHDFFSKRFPFALKYPLKGIISKPIEQKSYGMHLHYYTISIEEVPKYPIANIGWIIFYLLCFSIYFIKYY